tara:strand:- start:28 stop:417 length:390 start_codon:yes stop_codon:yes gene_type:complete
MSKSDILTAFNNHLTELVEALIEIMPEDVELKTAQVSISTLRKMNPRLIIPIWKMYVLDNYENEIQAGNIKFFLDKDYTEDVKNEGNAKEILDKIQIIKKSINELSEKNTEKTILYIQNLTKLCKVYYT